jgi:hypothetical protein
VLLALLALGVVELVRVLSGAEAQDPGVGGPGAAGSVPAAVALR